MSEVSKKIIYLANIRLPTEKAHGLQIMNMLEAFMLAGAKVELLLPNRDNPIHEDMFAYYHKSAVPVKKLWCWDLVSRAAWLGPMAFLIESLTFAWSVKKNLRNLPADAIIYTRDLWPLIFVSSRRKMVYEVHSLPQHPDLIYKKLLGKISKIVAITHGLKNNLLAWGLPTDKILVAPDAVDLQLFQEKPDPVECRAKLQLPLDKSLIVYTGHLYSWKGVDTLLEAATKLPEYTFVFVGGTPVDKESFVKKVEGKKINNVIVVGHVGQAIIPYYLGAADVLVLPNSAKVKISAEYTSPLKLFEYMAAARPIVASRLPSLQEILTAETATFFAPDDANSLAAAIGETLNNLAAAQAKAQCAKQAVQNFTWDKRARAILNFLK